MLFYKNASVIVKTFYGVTFNPGEVKGVPGFINDPKMIPTAEPQKKPSAVDSKPKMNSEKHTNVVVKSPKQGGKTDGKDNDK